MSETLKSLDTSADNKLNTQELVDAFNDPAMRSKIEANLASELTWELKDSFKSLLVNGMDAMLDEFCSGWDPAKCMEDLYNHMSDNPLDVNLDVAEKWSTAYQELAEMKRSNFTKYEKKDINFIMMSSLYLKLFDGRKWTFQEVKTFLKDTTARKRLIDLASVSNTWSIDLTTWKAESASSDDTSMSEIAGYDYETGTPWTKDTTPTKPKEVAVWSYEWLGKWALEGNLLSQKHTRDTLTARITEIDRMIKEWEEAIKAAATRTDKSFIPKKNKEIQRWTTEKAAKEKDLITVNTNISTLNTLLWKTPESTDGSTDTGVDEPKDKEKVKLNKLKQKRERLTARKESTEKRISKIEEHLEDYPDSKNFKDMLKAAEKSKKKIEKDIKDLWKKIDAASEAIYDIEDSASLEEKEEKLAEYEMNKELLEDQLSSIEDQITDTQDFMDEFDDDDDTDLKAVIKTLKTEQKKLSAELLTTEDAIDYLETSIDEHEESEEDEESGDKKSDRKDDKDDKRSAAARRKKSKTDKKRTSKEKSERREAREAKEWNPVPNGETLIGLDKKDLIETIKPLLWEKETRDQFNSYENFAENNLKTMFEQPEHADNGRGVGQLLQAEGFFSFATHDDSLSIFDEDLSKEEKISILKSTRSTLQLYTDATGDWLEDNTIEEGTTIHDTLTDLWKAFQKNNLSGEKITRSTVDDLWKWIMSNADKQGIEEGSYVPSVLEDGSEQPFTGEALSDMSDIYAQLKNKSANRSIGETRNLIDRALDGSYVFKFTDEINDDGDTRENLVIIGKDEIREFDSADFIKKTSESAGGKPIFEFNDNIDETMKAKIATPHEKGGIGISVKYLVDGLSAGKTQNLDMSLYIDTEDNKIPLLKDTIVTASDRAQLDWLNRMTSDYSLNYINDNARKTLESNKGTLESVRDELGDDLPKDESLGLENKEPDLIVSGPLLENNIGTKTDKKWNTIRGNKGQNAYVVSVETSDWVFDKQFFTGDQVNDLMKDLVPDTTKEKARIKKHLDKSDEFWGIDDAELFKEGVQLALWLKDESLDDISVTGKNKNNTQFSFATKQHRWELSGKEKDKEDWVPVGFEVTKNNDEDNTVTVTMISPSSALKSWSMTIPADKLEENFATLVNQAYAIDDANFTYETDTSDSGDKRDTMVENLDLSGLEETINKKEDPVDESTESSDK